MRVMIAIFVACFFLFSPIKSHKNHDIKKVSSIIKDIQKNKIIISNKGLKKVLSIAKDIKKNKINIDDVVKKLTPIIEDSDLSISKYVKYTI